MLLDSPVANGPPLPKQGRSSMNTRFPIANGIAQSSNASVSFRAPLTGRHAIREAMSAKSRSFKKTTG